MRNYCLSLDLKDRSRVSKSEPRLGTRIRPVQETSKFHLAGGIARYMSLEVSKGPVMQDL